MSALDSEEDSTVYQSVFWNISSGLVELVEDREPDKEIVPSKGAFQKIKESVFGSSDDEEAVSLETYYIPMDNNMIDGGELELEFRPDIEERGKVTTIRTENKSLSPIFINGIDDYAVPMFFRNLVSAVRNEYDVEFSDNINSSIDVFEDKISEMDERTKTMRKRIEFGSARDIMDSLGIPENVTLDSLTSDSDVKRFVESSADFKNVVKNGMGTKRYMIYSGDSRTYIVGEGEDQDLFIHPVNKKSNERRASINTIRDWMGYDYDFDEYTHETGNEFPGEGDRIRIQGDMKITKTLDLSSPEEAAEILYKLSKQIEYIDIHEKILQNKFRFRFNKDGSIRESSLLPNIEREDIMSGTTGISVMSKDGEIDKDQETLVEAKLGTVYDNQVVESIDEESMEEYSEIEQIPEENPESPGEVVIPIDNHLIVCGEAYECPYSGDETEPISIIVPTQTELSMVHDEHGEEKTTLDPGRYEIGLLDRV